MGCPIYLMRAWKTSMPVGHVWWQAPHEPDFSAKYSGHSSVNLIDVAVVGKYLKNLLLVEPTPAVK